MQVLFFLLLGIICVCVAEAQASSVALWKGKTPACRIVLPDDARAAHLAQKTMDRYLGSFYGVQLPAAEATDAAGTYIAFGNPKNNPTIEGLAKAGLVLTKSDLGDEGFQLRTFEHGGSHYIVVYGNTPNSLKYGAQELIFYHVPATEEGGTAEWPTDVMMKPDFPYRGIYMLPCWAQDDSIESWQRVLDFNSELTLNRNWFWLDGFKVAGHDKAQYPNAPLSNDAAVQGLIDRVNDDGMKFYIGGGWLMWHHEWQLGKDPVKGTQYYLDYLKTFKHVSGFYFEPSGEENQGKNQNWRMECESLRALIRKVQKEQPGFEVAIAIGRNNNKEYLELMSELDPKQTYWWWCWGDIHQDDACKLYPNVCEWHTLWVQGTACPPHSAMLEEKVIGQVTSYDPGMGFGQPWTGYAKLPGDPGARNVDPYSMPYFSHEYRFRERCWNTRLNEGEFHRRLGVRLFDAGVGDDAMGKYLRLADMCFSPVAADDKALEEIDGFVKAHAGLGTPRNRDTLARMAEAVAGIRAEKAKAAASR